jgi:D-tyrosyl-tRNA(Tyr) deacylase
MRAVLQRVSRARVLIGGEAAGAIGQGLVVLLGVAPDDTAEQARWLAEKTAHLRIFADDEGKMNRAIQDVGGGVLVVSQFTLYGDTAKGRRPSWGAAAPRPVSEPLIETFVSALRDLGADVASGVFGADMKVSLVNDGPVTVILDVD